jgi:hypothetical protein
MRYYIVRRHGTYDERADEARKKMSPPPPPPRPPALGGAVYAMLRVKLLRKLLCRVMILL